MRAAEAAVVEGAPGARALSTARRWRSSVAADLVGQQLAWWLAVLLVRDGRSALAAVPSLAFVALGVWALGSRGLALAGVGAAIGLAVDGALILSGAMTPRGALDLGFAASWMVGLWAAFALGFGASMRWLLDRSVLLSFALGAPAGVLAYRAGQALDVLTIADGWGALAAIALCWALATGLLRVLAPRSARERS